ncbi:MAG: zinc-binding dehydrogenase [Limnochordales bacterium]|nr:zinc-binding dehydrogenase [Limnochordales bacterium]
MRAAVIEQPGVVAIRDVPDPVAERGLGPDEVEIEVKAAGLCGTDWHIFRGEHGGVYPIIPGHEFAGVVLRPAPTSTPNASLLVLLSPPTPTSPAASAASVVPAAPITIATLAGGATSIVAADLRPERLRLARELGATHTVLLPKADDSRAAKPEANRNTAPDANGGPGESSENAGKLTGDELDEIMRALAPDGFELVIDASGSPSAVEMALTRNWVTPGGVLLVFGVAPPRARINLSPYLVYRRDITIVGSFAVNATFQAALELAASGRLDLERLVSDREPLDAFPDLLRRYGRGEVLLKAQILF